MEDPIPRGQNDSPRRAALEKKQLEYEKEMGRHRQRQQEIDQQVEDQKLTYANRERQIAETRSKITLKDKEIMVMREKIKIKRGMQTLKARYDPVPNDTVDVKVAEYCNQEGQTVPFKRIEQNHYMFGTLKIETIPDNRGRDFKVKVIKDGKTLSREAFFKKYEKNQLETLAKLNVDQELHVDEQSNQKVLGASPNRSTPARR